MIASSTLTYVLLGLCLLLFVGSFFLSSPRAPSFVRARPKLSGPLQLVALLGAYLVLRPGQSADFEQQQQQASAEHKLLFLSFHSNN